MKIISGGQTGVDQAALEAAKEVGLPTGGFAPFGFKTQKGANYDLRDIYGLQEHESSNYRERTFANVLAADATLRIAFSFSSAGEKCTLNAIKLYDKPHFDVKLFKDKTTLNFYSKQPVEEIAGWIRQINPNTLNIAGNSETTCYGIQSFARKLLVEIFKSLNI